MEERDHLKGIKIKEELDLKHLFYNCPNCGRPVEMEDGRITSWTTHSCPWDDCDHSIHFDLKLIITSSPEDEDYHPVQDKAHKSRE